MPCLVWLCPKGATLSILLDEKLKPKRCELILKITRLKIGVEVTRKKLPFLSPPNLNKTKAHLTAWAFNRVTEDQKKGIETPHGIKQRKLTTCSKVVLKFLKKQVAG